jgi:hypothetical protein
MLLWSEQLEHLARNAKTYTGLPLFLQRLIGERQIAAHVGHETA